VKATNGDTHLGGDDYAARIVDWLVTEYRKAQGIDLSHDRQAMQRLCEAAGKPKIELSNVVQTTVNLPFITADQNGPKHLECALTRARFEELTAELTERTIQPFKNAIADAKLDPRKSKTSCSSAARRVCRRSSGSCGRSPAKSQINR
jgi:molecular chaperone DnaK